MATRDEAQTEDLRLLQTADSDFEWMIRAGAATNRGLSLPTGGVDDAPTLARVRDIARRLRDKHCHATWMIVVHDEVVGLCGYKHPPSPDGVVDIGYGIAESRRRRGYATKAVAALLAQANTDPSIRIVEADTNAPNLPSQRLLEANGFRQVDAKLDPEDGQLVIRWRIQLPSSAHY